MSGSSPTCGGNIFLRIMLCALCFTVAVVCVLVALPGSSGRAAEAKNGVFDRSDNALWMGWLCTISATAPRTARPARTKKINKTALIRAFSRE